MKRHLGIAAMLCLLAPAAAAQRTIDPHNVFRVRPASCALADSLAGRALGRAKENAYGWAEGEMGMVVSNGVWEISARRPLDAIIVTATYRGLEPDRPHPDAAFALQIRMKDTVFRQGPAAALTLIFDDSTEAALGEMAATPGPMTHGNKIDQMLTLPLAPATIRRLAAASQLRGRLGTTPFDVPPKTLAQMRTAFVAATCGTRIR